MEVVEPNPHFVEYFDANRAKHPHLDIKEMKQVGIKQLCTMIDNTPCQGVGEDLLSAGVPDCSVDAVVMTLVLCTVQDQIKTLQVTFGY